MRGICNALRYRVYEQARQETSFRPESSRAGFCQTSGTGSHVHVGSFAGR